MISYKRDVLEVKMGRGSPICERVCKKIVEYINLLASTPHFGILGLTVEKDVPNLKL